jgi:hypothetical protein
VSVIEALNIVLGNSERAKEDQLETSLLAKYQAQWHVSEVLIRDLIPDVHASLPFYFRHPSLGKFMRPQPVPLTTMAFKQSSTLAVEIENPVPVHGIGVTQA